MGNRAVITFDKKPNKESIGIYLHWNGGPESVLAFVEAANQLKVHEDDYGLARMIQIIGNFLGGTHSLGVGKLKDLDCNNGDNGLFVVTREGGKVTIRQSKCGSFSDLTELNCDQLRKHRYWTECEEPIVTTILKANEAAFSERN